MSIKKRLSLKEAEKIFHKYFRRIKDAKSREYHTHHVISMSEMALLLAKGKRVDKTILRVAAFVHDIGYSIEKKDHAAHSLEILHREGYAVSEKLKDCILNHGSSYYPKTEEGKIFQLADKMDIFNPYVVRVILKYSRSKVSAEDLTYLKSMPDYATMLLKKYSVAR